MLRCYLRKSKQIHSHGSIHCRRCRNQVACVRDCIRMEWRGGIFNRVFNVHVAYNYDFHLELFGITVAQTLCIRCGTLIGWKILAITRRGQDLFLRAGRFLMMLHKLCSWNGEPLLRLNQLPHFGANEENADEDGGAMDEDGDEADEDGDEADQDGDTTDEDGDEADQDGDTTDEDGDEADQDGDNNEQNVDQDGVRNEGNADQDGGANEQNAGQDGGGNEQNAGQDGGRYEQTRDQDGGKPMN